MKGAGWLKVLGAGAGVGLGAWALGRLGRAQPAPGSDATTAGGGKPSLINVQWGPDAEGYTWDYLTTDYIAELTGVHPGFRRMLQAEVTPAHQEEAKRILREHYQAPIGTAVPFALAGLSHLGVLEQHYHPPGGKLKPWGPHKGISLFVEA